MLAVLASECTGNCSFTQQYVGLLTDLPHWLFEITSSVFQDILIGLVGWPLIKRVCKRRERKAHLVLDKEHGVTHVEGVDL